MFKHILIPTDGTPLSDQAIVYGAGFAKEIGALVTIVLVSTPFQAAFINPGFAAVPDNYREEYEAASRAVLKRTQDLVVAKGLQCKVAQVEQEHVYQGIIDTAKSESCDLILMASHGRRGLSAIVLGSETLKVLTHSTIPVLVFRAS